MIPHTENYNYKERVLKYMRPESWTITEWKETKKRTGEVRIDE